MNAKSATERTTYIADTIRKMLKPMRPDLGARAVAWRLSRPRTTAVSTSVILPDVMHFARWAQQQLQGVGVTAGFSYMPARSMMDIVDAQLMQPALTH